MWLIFIISVSLIALSAAIIAAVVYKIVLAITKDYDRKAEERHEEFERRYKSIKEKFEKEDM